MLDPAPDLQLQEQFGPVGLVLALLRLADYLLRCAHGKRILQVQLERGRVVLRAQYSLLLLEDTQDEPVDDQPAVLPKEQEEPLHLAQRDDLREERRDPVDAQADYVNALLCEVSGQLA